MLSYQWANQPFVKELKEFLEHHGLKVWIDLEQMHGSIMKRMQEAINHSKIIIFCMTKKYEHSMNCQLEFKYAFKQQKLIIPLKLEKFNPQNELDLITMGKMYYAFYAGENVENKKVELLHAIKKMLT